MTLERTTTEDPRSSAATPAATVSSPGEDDGPAAGRREVSTREIITSFGYQRFTNRELSRLDFAARLLDLAEDDKLALLERVKFMAIFAQLMDEFFQVRVAGLQDKVVAGVRTRSVDGLRPGEQLKVIRARVEELVRPAGPDLPRPARSGARRPLASGCRTGHRSTTTTGRTWSTSSTGRSSRC